MCAEARGRGLANFLSVQCPDIVGKVVGSSERRLAEVFEAARAVAPCIVLLDQIEALAPLRDRGGDAGGGESQDRLLSALLTELDGMRSSLSSSSADQETGADADADAAVVVIGVTSDKSRLDPAILRPGRLDQHIAVRMPSKEGRLRILQACLRDTPLGVDSEGGGEGSASAAPVPALLSDEPWCSLLSSAAAATEGLSGAQLSGVCRAAAMAALRETLAKRDAAAASETAMLPRHFREALKDFA